MGEADARRRLAECSDDEFVAILQEVLTKLRSGGWMTIEQVAELADMSVRSLQRRLAERGETFARVSEQTRAELASQMLKRTDRPLGEIASELGYTERTNFIRAFKRWTGVTPEQFRMESSDLLDEDPMT